MTSQREKDILLDQVLNNQIPKDALDEDSASLIGVASQLQAFLEETPPPPHGLKPGRSAFLTAAAQQPEKSKRFLFFPFPLPRLSRAAAWVMPFAAIFVLAIFVGFEVITKVPPTLHTPLMSGSNAISGITIVGALIVAGHRGSFSIASVGFIAVVLATINVVGGFLVTHRMLAMFKKR